MLAINNLQPGVKLTWKYTSQTGGLVHAQRAGITIKLFLWAGISIKTHFTLQKLKSRIVQENVQGFASHPWKGMTFYAVQCFRLLYSD